MPEEMVVDSLGVESDEADEAWESDEGFMEADDSVEDFGEAQRRRGRRSGRQRPAVRGVRGMTMRDADGRARNVAFPARLATTAETNRGLASQDVARRALEERIHRLEARNRQQLNNGAAVSGMVTLAIGGGLTALGLYNAQQATTNPNSTFFSRWAKEETTKMATLTSVTQLAATGAKALVDRRYAHSVIGITADAFAAVQLLGFALAYLQPTQPKTMATYTMVQSTASLSDVASAPGAASGDFIYVAPSSAPTDGGGGGTAGQWYVLSKNFANGGGLSAVPLGTPAAAPA
jgi:hypothetical protein